MRDGREFFIASPKNLRNLRKLDRLRSARVGRKIMEELN